MGSVPTNIYGDMSAPSMRPNLPPQPAPPQTQFNAAPVYDQAFQGEAVYDDLPESAYGGYNDQPTYGDTYGETGYPQSYNTDTYGDTGTYGDGYGYDQQRDPVYDNAAPAPVTTGKGYDHATDHIPQEPEYDETVGDMAPTQLLRAEGARELERDLSQEPWYHGQVSRPAADQLLTNNGDFLVRESVQARGQYILSAMQDGQPKHLLLVDPSGLVRTKDMEFDSVSHLINYHLRAHLPIISRGSRITLGAPVPRAAAFGESYSSLGAY
jgi:hypothetical protein